MNILWTKEEIDILINFYSAEGVLVANRLKNRSVNAIKNKAQELGLICRQQMNSWTEEEIDILKKYYPTEGKKVADRLPNRTVKTIQITAYRLGIKRNFEEKEEIPDEN